MFELVQAVVVGGVHYPEQRPGLEGDTAGVDVLDQLPEHVRLKLLDNDRLMLLNLVLNRFLNSCSTDIFSVIVILILMQPLTAGVLDSEDEV